jgi:thiol-disulfide isomerase/thioredoxin
MKKILALSVFLVLVSMYAASEDKSAAASPSMMAASDAASNFFDVKGLGPSVLLYSGEKQAQDLAKKYTTVYLFAATWCPTCRASFKDIVANHGKFPPDFRLIYVNYDTEKELKAKYGVTYQDTLVSIDGNGKLKKMWNGSFNVDTIIKASR